MLRAVDMVFPCPIRVKTERHNVMKEKKRFDPFIHLLQIPYGKYIYDLNKSSVFKVPDAVYAYLKDMTGEPDADIREYVENLKTQGYLKEKRVKVSAHPVTEYYHSFVKHNLRQLTLQVTQRCNLKCEYCAYSGNYFNREHTNKVMPFETAKKAIDYFISHSRDANYFGISFYGGEPLLEFELIKKCVAYADSRAEGRKVSYNFTTNGTLLTEEKYEYLVEHDFAILVSLDGPQEVHDRHRVFAGTTIGSFQQMFTNLRNLKEKYPRYYAEKISFNMVIDPSYPIKDICDFTMRDKCVCDAQISSTVINDILAKEKNVYSEQFTEEYEYEKFKVFLSKLGWLKLTDIPPLFRQHFTDIKKVAICLERIQQSEMPDNGHRGGPCILGVRKLFVDVEGRLFPCERVSEASGVSCIGHINQGIDEEKALRLLNIECLTSEHCRKCWAYALCPDCFALADDEGRLSKEKQLTGCQMNRIRVEDSIKDYLVLHELKYNSQLDT